jgi:hypothetical protein
MTKERRLQALRRQIRRLETRAGKLERTSNLYSWVRLIIFAVGAIAGGFVYFLGYPAFFWVPPLAGLLLFAIVVHYHRQIDDSLTRHRAWSVVKENHIARAQLDWGRLPVNLSQPEHSLELDLDLVGEHSLHRLVDTAVSQGGSRRLREWLANPVPDPQATLQRQQIVRELVPLSLFRDKLTLKGILAAEGKDPWSPEKVLDWLERHALPPSLRIWLFALTALAALNATLFVLNLFGVIPPIWRLTLALYLGLLLLQSREIGEPFREAAHLRDILEQLTAVFGHLEAFSNSKKSHVRVPFLRALCEPFLKESHRPSLYLARVRRVVNATGVRGNPILWLALNILAPWDTFFAYLLDQYKKEIARRLPGWMNIWFEVEALSSLANLAYLNPRYTFPEITVDGQTGRSPIFQTRELGHPLLPDQERICNDFTVDSMGEINIFTGSNMSGKSTFLRTVGINLLLAFAGGPVNARELRTIPFRPVSCIRISDSVTEIFRGTNNRERLAGSRAYIQALAGKPGVGLLSTHDLELIHLAEEVKALKNYHFRDDIVDGRMVFDYKLHLGPSPTTNALKIMEMEGLPVSRPTH